MNVHRRQIAVHARAPRQARRQVAVERTRQDILLAAFRAFGRSGFQSASMREIAQEAGFTAPALYVYFNSKEEIFTEGRRLFLSELLSIFDEPFPPGLSFSQKVSVLVRRLLEWADHRREIFTTLFTLRMRGELPPPGEPSRAGAAQAGRSELPAGPHPFIARLTRFIEGAADPGRDLAGGDAAVAAHLLAGIAHAFFLRWLKGTPGVRLAESTDRIVDFYFHGLLGARAGAAAGGSRAKARPRTKKQAKRKTKR
jgi:AcrR family transcriptional regulator